jgi:manganese/zinc/iron transport system substrate-binding protein
MTTRRQFTGACAAIIALAFSYGASAQSAKPLNVVATTGMVADLVRSVGAGRVRVSQLMGEGVDPHLYKATRTDIAAMLGADVVFYNGLLLEGKLSDALVRIATAGRPVFAVTELIDESALLHSDEAGGHFDPHVWMDPRAWSKAVQVVRDKLASRDPAGAEVYRANATKLESDIAALDAYAERVLSAVPPERRVLVTAHDAFSYFGRRYGFEVQGIQGISTESEAGLKQIENLVNLLVSRNIPAVFVESTIPDRSIRALIAGAKAKGRTVTIGGELFSDAMGKPGTYEGSYIGMIDHNVTAIARALGSDAPAKGFRGQLARRE